MTAKLTDIQDNISVLSQGQVYRIGVVKDILADITDNISGKNSSPINVLEYAPTLDPTGVEDGNDAWGDWRALIKSLGGDSAPQTFTITIGSPSVINLANHGFRKNEAFTTETTGVFPTGHVAGTVYYIKGVGFTKDSFEYSTVNNFSSGIGETAQTAVNTSGSQSGTHTLRARGREWMEVIVPRGKFVTNKAIMDGGQYRCKISAYGAVFNSIGLGSTLDLAHDQDGIASLYALIEFAIAGTNTVTLKTLADVSKFWVGQWICIIGLDCQNTLNSQISYPPNNHYSEFKRISAINTGTGVITIEGRLNNSYDDTWPLFYAGTGVGGADSAGGGPATILGMNPRWDMTIVWCGPNLADSSLNSYPKVRDVVLIDCHMTTGVIPTENHRFFAKRCIWGTGSPNYAGQGTIEVDKLIELAVWDDCIIDSLSFQSSSCQLAIFKACEIGWVDGTTKNTVIHDCIIDQVLIGPLGFGYAENTVITGSRVGQFLKAPRFVDPGQVLALAGLPQKWTFTNGTISVPMASSSLRANALFVPGGTYYFNDYAGNYQNLGKPFKALRVYTSANNFCVDTTLDAFPTGDSSSHTVTITQASPAVVSWTAHSLIAGTPIVFITTGSLLTGITEGTVYYVISAGLATDSFRFSTSVGGSAVNTTGTQSGTHTAIANALHMQPHQGAKVTMFGNTGGQTILDQNGLFNEPIYTRAKRLFVGTTHTNLAYLLPPTLWGNLVSLRVNVRKAYTGTGALALLVTANTADANCAITVNGLSQSIDLRTAGERAITPSAATGSVGADSISAFGDWITGPVQMVHSTDAGVATFNQQPIVSVEIETDQGITKYDLIQATVRTHPIMLADTSMNISGA